MRSAISTAESISSGKRSKGMRSDGIIMNF